MTHIPSVPHQSNATGGVQPHRGTAILVLGILSLVICAVCGVVAWVMGNADLRAMDQGVMDPTGRSMTQAGRVLGIVGTCILILQVIAFVVWLLILAGFFAAAAGAAGAHGSGGPV